jgi:hypothetical protein
MQRRHPRPPLTARGCPWPPRRRAGTGARAARLRHPLPRGERKIPHATDIVLAARFLIGARVMRKPRQGLRRNSDLRQIDPAVEGRRNHDRARRKIKNKKEAERRQTLLLNRFAFRQSARPADKFTQSAQPICKARSPVGVPRRLFPRDSRIPRRDFGPGFAERSAIDGGGLPPAPAPVAASTSRAGHGAGRHDARSRSGAEVTSPAREHRLPLRRPLSPGRRLLSERRGRAFYSARAACQAPSPRQLLAVDSTAYFPAVVRSRTRAAAFHPA